MNTLTANYFCRRANTCTVNQTMQMIMFNQHIFKELFSSNFIGYIKFYKVSF